jgi:hypothetical protein
MSLRKRFEERYAADKRASMDADEMTKAFRETIRETRRKADFEGARRSGMEIVAELEFGGKRSPGEIAAIVDLRLLQ